MDTSQGHCHHKGVFPHGVSQAPAVVKLYDGAQWPREVARVVVFTNLGFAVEHGAVTLAFFYIRV